MMNWVNQESQQELRAKTECSFKSLSIDATRQSEPLRSAKNFN